MIIICIRQSPPTCQRFAQSESETLFAWSQNNRPNYALCPKIMNFSFIVLYVFPFIRFSSATTKATKDIDSSLNTSSLLNQWSPSSKVSTWYTKSLSFSKEHITFLGGSRFRKTYVWWINQKVCFLGQKRLHNRCHQKKKTKERKKPPCFVAEKWGHANKRFHIYRRVEK